MTSSCTKWKDPLVEAALTGATTCDLDAHLTECEACSQELARLRAQQAQIDSLLPLIARGAGPRPEFQTRVLAAAEAGERRTAQRPRWIAAISIAAAVLAAVMLMRTSSSGSLTPAEIRNATALAHWQAPSDVLLETPGSEFLRTTPRIGEPDLNFSTNPYKEK